VVFQHPGSPSCPQQFWPKATRRHKLLTSFPNFSRSGMG
jgi:hypothetical protein